ncbi:MAG TPA: GntR family transcriptional regulator [Thermomicrobiales bacterium]|nr:GntR family transcriptional regulator [Thermomicrobiales bacterium]
MAGSRVRSPIVADRVAGDPPAFNHATLAQQVYQHLRQQILDNRYPPGAPLPEASVAADFKVSRVPVREALRRLEAEGLVAIAPRQGAVVSDLSPQQFLDAYRVREVLEALAMQLAAPRLDEDDRDRLRALQGEMRDAAATADADRFFVANRAFHALIVERSANEYLQAIYFPLMDQMRRYRSPSLELRGGLERSIDEHDAILRALAAGDGEEAARLLREHIQAPQRALEQFGADRLPLAGDGQREDARRDD